MSRWSGSLRGEGVEATGLHLQQPVLPVGSGDTEVVDGAPQDAEGFSPQSELRGVGPQTVHAAHSSRCEAIPTGGGQSTVRRRNDSVNYCEWIEGHGDI